LPFRKKGFFKIAFHWIPVVLRGYQAWCFKRLARGFSGCKMSGFLCGYWISIEPSSTIKLLRAVVAIKSDFARFLDVFFVKIRSISRGSTDL
jgi:hypothetical protein